MTLLFRLTLLRILSARTWNDCWRSDPWWFVVCMYVGSEFCRLSNLLAFLHRLQSDTNTNPISRHHPTSSTITHHRAHTLIHHRPSNNKHKQAARLEGSTRLSCRPIVTTTVRTFSASSTASKVGREAQTMIRLMIHHLRYVVNMSIPAGSSSRRRRKAASARASAAHLSSTQGTVRHPVGHTTETRRRSKI